MFALLLVGVVGVSGALTDNVTFSYTFDNSDTSGTTAVDASGSINATLVNSVTTGATGKIGEAYTFGSTKYVVADTNPYSANIDELTIAVWVKPSSLPATLMDIISTEDIIPGNGYTLRWNSNKLNFFRHTGGTASTTTESSINPLTSGSWQFIVVTFDTGNATIYVDDVQVGSSTAGTYIEYGTANPPVIGNFGDNGHAAGGTRPWLGEIDDVTLYDRKLNRSELTTLYNSGAGLQYPFSTPSGNTTYVSLTAIDAYDGSSITTFNASLTNTSGTYDFSTTNGTINTNIDKDATGTFNITFTAPDYFSNTSNNVDVSSGSYEGSMAQGFVSFRCVEIYTNDTLTCDEEGPYPRKLDTYTDTINVSGYFSNPTTYTMSKTRIPSVSSPFNTTTTNPKRTLRANYSWEGNWVNPEALILPPSTVTNARGASDGTTATFYFNTSPATGALTGIFTPSGNAYVGTIPSSCNAQATYQGRVESVSVIGGPSYTTYSCWDGSTWSTIRSVFSTSGSSTPPSVGALYYNGEFFAVESRGFYNFLLNVTAQDFRGFLETDFNINLTNSELGINFTNSSGDCGCNQSAAYQLLMGYTYNVSVQATDTIYSDPVDAIAYFNVTNVTSSPPETLAYQVNLTAARTVNLAYYYEDNRSVFTQNVTAFFIPIDDFNNLFFTSSTTNGTSTINNIPVGAYIVQMLVNPAAPSGPPGLGGDSAGYHNEERFIILTSFSSGNLTGYFRENTTGEHKDFQVYDTDSTAPNGWIIRAQRYYNGTGWITVDEGRTNIDGLSNINLLSDEYYKLLLYDEDFTLQYASDRTLLPSSSYTLTPSSSSVIYDYINTTTGVSSGITVLTADNGSTYFRGDVSSSAGVQTWTLDVYREYSNNRVLVATTDSTTTAGSLIAFIPNTTGRYTATVSVGSTPVDNAEYTVGGFKDAIGAGGAVYAFLLMIGMIGIGIFSAPTAIILGVISLIVAAISGLFYVGWSALIGFAIVGGMIIMRRER